MASIKKYTVVKNKKTSKWTVIEVKNGIVLYNGDDETKARTLYRSLNRGSGFNGHTPPFIAAR